MRLQPRECCLVLTCARRPFTVFAPTDAAFAALPKGTVESLLLPENKEKLTNILLCVASARAVLCRWGPFFFSLPPVEGLRERVGSRARAVPAAAGRCWLELAQAPGSVDRPYSRKRHSGAVLASF